MRGKSLAISDIDHGNFMLSLLSVTARLKILVDVANGMTKV
jgi:hypothetical protein